MKFLSALFVFLGLQAIGVFATAVPGKDIKIGRPSNEELAKECGDLGVMVVPPGMDPLSVRHCANHPVGLVPTGFLKREDLPKGTPDDVFRSKACNTNGPPYGCSRGYCWRECGARYKEWCWIAEGNGSGPWVRCNDPEQCKTGGSCGVGCPSCGCSC